MADDTRVDALARKLYEIKRERGELFLTYADAAVTFLTDPARGDDRLVPVTLFRDKLGRTVEERDAALADLAKARAERDALRRDHAAAVEVLGRVQDERDALTAENERLKDHLRVLEVASRDA